MIDPRVEKLAQMLVNYSCAVQKGERALVEAIDVPHEFTNALVRAISDAGGFPLVMLKSNQVLREMLLRGTREQWGTIADIEMAQMERMDCYIGARGNPNVSQLSDVPADKQKLYEQTVWKRVHHDIRIKQHALVRASLAQSLDGPDGRDEHRGV